MVPGYGNMAAAITGFYELTGWGDRSPAGPYLAYTDGVSPRFMLATLMAALEHKRRTGEGQHIDISQAEAAIHLLAPAILDYELNGNTWRRMGNRDIELCPHGVFPAAGEDRWVAIACNNNDSWRALCDLCNLHDLAGLVDAPARQAREDAIEMRIADWTRQRDADEIVGALIARGVAAHVVQNAPECMQDPQLAHRNHYIRAPHTGLGELMIENTRFLFSRTPARVSRAGPELGEHNVDVLTGILGYDMDRVADIFASLAME